MSAPVTACVPYENIDETALEITRKNLESTKFAVEKMEQLRNTSDLAPEAEQLMTLFTQNTNTIRLTACFSEITNLCERVVVQVSTILQLYVQEKRLTPFLRSAFEVYVAQLEICDKIIRLNQEILGDLYVKYGTTVPGHYEKVVSFIEKRQVLKEVLAKHQEQ